MERQAWYYFVLYPKDERKYRVGEHNLWFLTDSHGWVKFSFNSRRSPKKHRERMPDLHLFFRMGTSYSFCTYLTEHLSSFREVMISKELSDYYENERFTRGG